MNPAISYKISWYISVRYSQPRLYSYNKQRHNVWIVSTTFPSLVTSPKEGRSKNKTTSTLSRAYTRTTPHAFPMLIVVSKSMIIELKS